ncbi:TRIO and F-actin binding protein b [Electrophorus electricus]|uniref:TRIO and F-actin binding protein b n=1 Tax=Electrophorus electricus TaxID=8005 RepID=UPI0015CFD4E1|nr:TRIO and F-actin binding protein b [Electrophorus electricus]
MTPDLLNFKKGWMSKLDESGEWKKHWFVLTDAGLKYYRDSGAEEKDELDGEIDLRSCVKVSEFDVDRNYGFQIQTEDGVVTLSAMTAGIRRNWIEVLRKSIRPISCPDLTQLPDNSSIKVNSRHTSSHHLLSQSEILSAANSTHRRFDYVELSPVATPPSPANQREAGEGQVHELGQGQEERRRGDSWEAVLLRKGLGHSSDQKRIEEEIEQKWVEFERLPLKEMRSLPVLGLRSGPSANEALQREVASLRQQLERARGAGGVGGCVCVGGEGGWRACLEQMERVHKEVLEELQRQHVRQTEELERERERELKEEARATACAMEVLKKAHQEELEREVQKSKSLRGHRADPHKDHQQVEVVCLRRELQSLSEQYTQKCVQLTQAQQSSGVRQRELDIQERELEQLRRENQDLHTRLAEEIQRMRSCITGQEEVATGDTKLRTVCELEVLLRVKNTEVNYLQKEITCLRNEVHFLNVEKQSVCERYMSVCEDLKVFKERNEQELQSLREHLRLAMAALQEGQGLGNSLQH